MERCRYCGAGVRPKSQRCTWCGAVLRRRLHQRPLFWVIVFVSAAALTAAFLAYGR